MNDAICRNAMEQGYADLYHKMHCNLPHTGTDLYKVLMIGIILLLAGALAVLLTRGRANER